MSTNKKDKSDKIDSETESENEVGCKYYNDKVDLIDSETEESNREKI